MSGLEGANFLRERGLIQRTTLQTQQLIGCLGCRWQAEISKGNKPTAYGRQVMKCADLNSGVVYPILKRLEGTGAVESAWDNTPPIGRGGPPRRVYFPADSELGRSFAASIGTPGYCRLEDTESVSKTPETLISDYIDSASAAELRDFIGQAEERLTLLEEQ